ncbi:MAG: hypothetical protein IJ158_12465 [Treponema sp.]|nr:hypothetical protein [Treponema sp.]
MKTRFFKVFVCFFITSVVFVACNKKVASSPSPAAESVSQNGIDYDLSQMNGNLVYAEVFNMMVEPELYEDKVIKMRGNFVVYEDSPTTGGRTYAVLISDALACCQQGIEFHYDFNGNEPQDGEEILVTGVYVTDLLADEISYNYVKAQSVERL